MFLRKYHVPGRWQSPGVISACYRVRGARERIYFSFLDTFVQVCCRWLQEGYDAGVVIKTVCSLGHNKGRDPMCACCGYRRRLEWLENDGAGRWENVELCAEWRPPTQLKFLYHNLLTYITIYNTYYIIYLRDATRYEIFWQTTRILCDITLLSHAIKSL